MLYRCNRCGEITPEEEQRELAALKEKCFCRGCFVKELELTSRSATKAENFAKLKDGCSKIVTELKRTKVVKHTKIQKPKTP